MAVLDIPDIDDYNTDTIEEIEDTISSIEDLALDVSDHPYMDDDDLDGVHELLTEAYALHDEAMIS